jgi:hypothetical protein
MDAIVRCAGNRFAYSPRNHTQGRAGESSPALLCLGFELDAFDLAYGETNATAKKGGFEFPILPPAAQGHGCDFPSGCQISSGKVGRGGIGVGMLFHGDIEYSFNISRVTTAFSTIGLSLKNTSVLFELCHEAARL